MGCNPSQNSARASCIRTSKITSSSKSKIRGIDNHIPENNQ